MGHILARDICVDFPIFTNSSRSMKNIVLRAGTGGRIAKDAANSSYVRSLDHLTFEIRAGERIGLMGHNGSGKTTLLRTLCGVYAPTAGRLSVTGRVVSLLDISLGMDPDGTGYENIMTRGIVMGLTPRQIAARIGRYCRVHGPGGIPFNADPHILEWNANAPWVRGLYQR